MPINYDLSYSTNVIIFCEMKSRAGGGGAGRAHLWLPGSVGARPRDSLVPACRCQSVTGLDFGGSSAVAEVQSAGKLR